MSVFDLDPATAKGLSAEIRNLSQSIGRPVRLMEVCGTHTMSIFRAGLPALLPEGVRLLSGPGCPVCVTPMGYMDAAMELAARPEVTLATFGDMLKVPGSETTLEKLRAGGADVRIVYSAFDALHLAEKSPVRQVVFLGIGFETTAPTTAITLGDARRAGIKNFSVLSAHKVVPPALRVLLANAAPPPSAVKTSVAPSPSAVKNESQPGAVAPQWLDGFILPGHVSVILGSRPYEFIAREFGRAAVITGFEPADILQAIRMLMRQVADGTPKVEIEYAHVVRPEGNPAALKAIEDHFEVVDAEWRGLGMLPGSGLKIRQEFADYDALIRFGVTMAHGREPKGCHCGEVLQGQVIPPQCPLFGKKCTPLHPVGACMVSSEGTCSAYYKYHRTAD